VCLSQADFLRRRELSNCLRVEHGHLELGLVAVGAPWAFRGGSGSLGKLRGSNHHTAQGLTNKLIAFDLLFCSSDISTILSPSREVSGAVLVPSDTGRPS